MKVLLKIVGAVMLLSVIMWALIMMLLENWIGFGISVAMIGMLLIVFTYEFFHRKPLKLEISSLFKGVALMMSGVITFYLSAATNSILAAALMGLIGAMLLLPYKAPIYVGAFIGMTVVLNIFMLLICLLIGAIIYILLEDELDGIGGKYGTIAFVSVFIIVLFFNRETSPINIDLLTNLLLIGVAIASSLATFFLNKYVDNTVLSSAFIGLLFGAVLLFSSEPIIKDVCLIGFAATFIGMQTRFKYYLLFISAILLVILYNFYYLYAGIGGSLGFLAFLSLMPLVCVDDIIKRKNPFLSQPLSQQKEV